MVGAWEWKNAVLVQLPVFQEPVFEGEAFFFPLAPLFKVEVDVGALQRKNKPVKTRFRLERPGSSLS